MKRWLLLIAAACLAPSGAQAATDVEVAAQVGDPLAEQPAVEHPAAERRVMVMLRLGPDHFTGALG